MESYLGRMHMAEMNNMMRKLMDAFLSYHQVRLQLYWRLPAMGFTSPVRRTALLDLKTHSGFIGHFHQGRKLTALTIYSLLIGRLVHLRLSQNLHVVVLIHA